MITNTWKINGVFNADANKVAAEITSIGDEVTPQQIVDKARDSSTELHKCFEWDDSVAAEKYRLCQARKVVQLLVIDNHDDEKEPQAPIRLMYKPEGARGYQQTIKIVQNVDAYQSLLTVALAELQAFKRKYSSLRELDYILDLI